MIINFNYDYSYWELRHKVTFDGVEKLIIVNDNVSELDIRTEVYSAWIEWLELYDNSKYLQAMRFTGLDPIGQGSFTGDSYFLINNWRLVVDLTKVKITGILFSDNYSTAYYSKNLVPQYPATVSSLVNTVTNTENVVTGNIEDVWNKVIEGNLTAAQLQKIMFAALAGKMLISGNNVSFRDLADTLDRINATVDNSGRTNVTVNGS